jgi:Glycosyltransferase (GlcNAc)
MATEKSLSRSLLFAVRDFGFWFFSQIPYCFIHVRSLTYPDGARCGKTIVDLFAKAKDPDNIIVGIIDQSTENDLYCLEAYCKEMGKCPGC